VAFHPAVIIEHHPHVTVIPSSWPHNGLTVLLETGCDGAGAAKPHRKCRNSRHGRPARAPRHGRDGHDTTNVTPGRSHHPAPGRAHFSVSVIDAIETKDEEKLGREALGPHCGRAMGVSRWRRCRASAAGDVAQASCPVGQGRPARATRHGRDGHGTKKAAQARPTSLHPAAHTSPDRLSTL